jgi:hypothetical protein
VAYSDFSQASNKNRIACFFKKAHRFAFVLYTPYTYDSESTLEKQLIRWYITVAECSSCSGQRPTPPSKSHVGSWRSAFAAAYERTPTPSPSPPPANLQPAPPHGRPSVLVSSLTVSRPLAYCFRTSSSGSILGRRRRKFNHYGPVRSAPVLKTAARTTDDATKPEQ